MKWTEDDIKYLIENYPKLTIGEISENLSYKYNAIQYQIKKLGIESRKNKKYKEKIFNLEDKEDLYLMGFLWADGYLHDDLNRLELSILTDDYNDISNLIDKDCWAIYHRDRKNRRPQTSIGLYREDVCNVFRDEYNYTEKSYVCPNFLEQISNELLMYFIRGFFDGDGCFYLSKDKKTKQCYLAGAYDQDWSWIEDILIKLGIVYIIKQKIQNKGKVNESRYSIIYINKGSIKIFGNYIYENYDGIGLSRKYNKFLDMELI